MQLRHHVRGRRDIPVSFYRCEVLVRSGIVGTWHLFVASKAVVLLLPLQGLFVTQDTPAKVNPEFKQLCLKRLGCVLTAARPTGLKFHSRFNRAISYAPARSRKWPKTVHEYYCTGKRMSASSRFHSVSHAVMLHSILSWSG